MAYQNLILDDSIFDVDSWFPQSVVDEIVEVVISYEKSLRFISFEDRAYLFEEQVGKHFEKSNSKGYDTTFKQNIRYSDVGVKVA